MSFFGINRINLGKFFRSLFHGLDVGDVLDLAVAVPLLKEGAIVGPLTLRADVGGVDCDVTLTIRPRRRAA